MISAQPAVFSTERPEMHNPDNTALGILDFSHAPFALGDTVTWLINLCVLAQRNSKTIAEVFIYMNSYDGFAQPFIDTHQANDLIVQLSAVFEFSPVPIKLTIWKDRTALDNKIRQWADSGVPSWPSYQDYFSRKLDYAGHREIVAYHQEFGTIPRLVRRATGENRILEFCKRRAEHRDLVCINVRQRRLREDWSSVERDSSAEAWLDFIKKTSTSCPSIHFVLLGGWDDWDRRFARLPNLTIPRAHGFDLTDEIDCLLASRLFIGTSSGFAAAATFSEVPYWITNYEHKAVEHACIALFDLQYSFSLNDQKISWEIETDAILTQLLESSMPLMNPSRGPL